MTLPFSVHDDAELELTEAADFYDAEDPGPGGVFPGVAERALKEIQASRLSSSVRLRVQLRIDERPEGGHGALHPPRPREPRRWGSAAREDSESFSSPFALPLAAAAGVAAIVGAPGRGAGGGHPIRGAPAPERRGRSYLAFPESSPMSHIGRPRLGVGADREERTS